MKFYISVLVYTSLFFSALAQQSISKRDSLFSGKVETYFDNGKTKSIGYKRNGQKVGQWKSFFEDGALKSATVYNRGQKQKYRSFFKTGAKFWEKNYVNNKTFQKQYNREGILVYESTPTDTTGLHYASNEYTKEGILKYKKFWTVEFNKKKEKSRINEGRYQILSPKGAVLFEYVFMNTYVKHKKLSNGEYISFYNDGTVKYRGLIVDDTKHGVETHYKPSGDFDFNVKYNNGEIISNNSKGFKDSFLPQFADEIAPLFPGCKIKTDNMQNRKGCLSKNITKHVTQKFNSHLASELKIKGQILILSKFIINEEGFVTDIEVRAPHPTLAKEAKRVLMLLPQFQPGQQRGEIVDVPYSLPIKFIAL